MDQRKPLSYESLKSVVQYMDAKFRAYRVFRLPSLRNVQKVIPQRLDVLKLNKTSFTLDNMKFSFNIVLERNDERIHFPNEVDEFGPENTNRALMPGDIVIGDPQRGRLLFGDQFGHFNGFDGYRSYVACTVRSGSNQPFFVARTDYGGKIGDMIRKVLNKFLGGRRVHYVKHLEIAFSDGTIRLPKELKLIIQELSVEKNGNNVIETLRSIFDESSFPLQTLSIEVESPTDHVFQNEILKTSTSLKIINKQLFGINWRNVLITLPKTTIHFEKDISLWDIICLARNWMEHPRAIGTRFSMNAGVVGTYLLEVASQLEAVAGVIPERRCDRFLSCYTLPMTSTSELNIYGYESPNQGERMAREYEQPFMFVMEIMPIGSFQPR